MKIEKRVVLFAHESPIDTGCGKVYNLASTDLLPYPVSHTASFELAEQSVPGELHEHHLSHETYICIDGKGIVDWGTSHKCVFQKGNVINIVPHTLHALSATPPNTVKVLVVSYPRFTQADLYKIELQHPLKRRAKRPPFFIKAPAYGTLIEHAHVHIRRARIEAPYVAAGIELVFVLSGNGTLKIADQQQKVTRYDSFVMEKGNHVLPQPHTSLDAIIVQLT